jgi:ATP-dependent protease ClpP protease subunit
MSDLQFELPKEPTRVWDLYVPVVVRGKFTTGLNYCPDRKYVNIYITDTIVEPHLYNELQYTLSQCNEGDDVKMHINTPGGDLDTTIAVMDSMKKCKANITGYITGTVGSAGTMIAMCCTSIEVSDHSSFMVHTYSTIIQGKGNEVKAQQDFSDVATDRLIRDVYKDFMTPEELTLLIEGKDYWFNKEQLLTRWENKTNVN